MHESTLWNKGMVVAFVIVLVTALAATTAYHFIGQDNHENPANVQHIELGKYASWDGGEIWFDGRALFPVSYGDLPIIGLLS